MIKLLGRGNGGSVQKVFHRPTKLFLAHKVCASLCASPCSSRGVGVCMCECECVGVFLRLNSSAHLPFPLAFSAPCSVPGQIIFLELKPEVRNRILRELKVREACQTAGLAQRAAQTGAHRTTGPQQMLFTVYCWLLRLLLAQRRDQHPDGIHGGVQATPLLFLWCYAPTLTQGMQSRGCVNHCAWARMGGRLTPSCSG